VLSALFGESFALTLLEWQKQYGRQNLPWQNTGDAYKVWLSEVMLQQTQVVTVLGYYSKFLEAFPTVADLAAASEESVMQLWAGLGYYIRARNLHQCAQQVVNRFGGHFPSDVLDLESLPGIGRSTAGAIASLAYGVSAPILDGNVKRVFCRYYGIEGYPELSSIKKKLWILAEGNVPVKQAGLYNQALMDLGATCCTPRKPNCIGCPLKKNCFTLSQEMWSQLPSPKPKKIRSEFYYISLIVQCEQTHDLLLQLLSNKGVWQGLWMPPISQCSNQITLEEVAGIVNDWVKNYGLAEHEEALLKQVTTLNEQPWLVHQLTHRKMHFKMLALLVQSTSLTFYKMTEKPVPKIVHKMMAQLSVSRF
jgi:A/G-specific adenine glycosylase